MGTANITLGYTHGYSAGCRHHSDARTRVRVTMTMTTLLREGNSVVVVVVVMLCCQACEGEGGGMRGWE